MKTGHNTYVEGDLDAANHLNNSYCSVFSEINCTNNNKLGNRIGSSNDGSFLGFLETEVAEELVWLKLNKAMGLMVFIPREL